VCRRQLQQCLDRARGANGQGQQGCLPRGSAAVDCQEAQRAQRAQRRGQRRPHRLQQIVERRPRNDGVPQRRSCLGLLGRWLGLPGRGRRPVHGAWVQGIQQQPGSIGISQQRLLPGATAQQQRQQRQRPYCQLRS
jgi:hypothetical protein